MRISDWSSDVCSSDLLERDPGGAEQPFEEAAIIIGPHLARKRKGQRGDDAPDEGREQHRGKPAPRARRHEIFGQLAPRRIAAADDDGLPCETGQQETLEPRRALRPAARLAPTHARHFSPNPSKDAPPRTRAVKIG